MDLSIIIPVYNSEKYLERCLISLKNQSYGNMEFIIINDGSTDNSPEICDKYARIDARFKIIHQNNMGPCYARFNGIHYAKGEYVGFVDSDDRIDDRYFEIMVKTAIETDSDITVSHYIEEGGGGKAYHDPSLDGIYEDENIRNKLLHRLTGFSLDSIDLTPALWNKIYRRNIITDAEKYTDKSLRVGEDLVINILCLLNSHKVTIINNREYLYHYFINPYQITKKVDGKNIEFFKLLIDNLNLINKNCGFDFSKEINFFAFNGFWSEIVKISNSKTMTVKEKKSMIKKVLNEPQLFVALKNMREIYGLNEKIKYFLLKHKFAELIRLLTVRTNK